MLKNSKIINLGLLIIASLCISSLLVSCGSVDVNKQLAKDVKRDVEKIAVSQKDREYYSRGYNSVLIDDNSKITVGEVIQIGKFYENVKELPMNANTVDKALQNKIALKYLGEYDYFLKELQKANCYPEATFGEAFYYIDTLVRDEKVLLDKNINASKAIYKSKDELFRLHINVDDNFKASNGNTIVREVKIHNSTGYPLQWIRFSSTYGRGDYKITKEEDYISLENLYEDPDLKNKVKGDILIAPFKSKTYWYPSKDGKTKTRHSIIGSVRFIGVKDTINSLEYYYSKGLLPSPYGKVGVIPRSENKVSNNWWCEACGRVSRTPSYGPCHGSRDGRHYWNATSMEP